MFLVVKHACCDRDGVVQWRYRRFIRDRLELQHYASHSPSVCGDSCGDVTYNIITYRGHAIHGVIIKQTGRCGRVAFRRQRNSRSSLFTRHPTTVVMTANFLKLQDLTTSVHAPHPHRTGTTIPVGLCVHSFWSRWQIPAEVDWLSGLRSTKNKN